MIVKSMPKQYGGPIRQRHRATCRGIQHIRPRQFSGSSTMIGSPTKVGILGDPHPGLNSIGFISVQRSSGRRIRLRHRSGNQAATGSQLGPGIRGKHHPGLNCIFLLCSEMSFACRTVNSLAIDGRCRQIHLPHATFSHVPSLHRSHNTDDMCAWQKIELRLPKKVIHPRAQVFFFSLSLSLFYVSCVTVVLFSEPRLVVHVSHYPL